MKIEWYDRLPYKVALLFQENAVADKIRDPNLPDRLLLMEHDSVYTIGRTPDQSSLRNRAALPFPLVVTGRGGQATYHGPGQLIGYPILDLKTRGRDLHLYLRAIEDTLIEVCTHYGVHATRREGLTGVWVGDKKIASIGVGVRRWISMHGFSLNVTGNLAPYREITPCGITGVHMTSLTDEAGYEISVADAAEFVGPLCAKRLAPDQFSIR